MEEIKSGQKEDLGHVDRVVLVNQGKGADFRLDQNGVLMFRDRVCVPDVPELKKCILDEGHRSSLCMLVWFVRSRRLNIKSHRVWCNRCLCQNGSGIVSLWISLELCRRLWRVLIRFEWLLIGWRSQQILFLRLVCLRWELGFFSFHNILREK